jgi:p-aminobenzoyl-glutamate transporter AbgT
MFTLIMLIDYTIFFVPLAVMILPGIVSPRQWWWRTQARKYQNPEANEPSELAYQNMQRNSMLGLGFLLSCFLLLLYLQFQELKAQELQTQQLLKMQQFDRDMKDPQKKQQILRELQQTGKPSDRSNQK